MSNVSMSTQLPVSADQVWSVIGNFNALAQWHPAVESSSLEEGGTVRRLTLAGDGGEIVERLEHHDDQSRSYTYSILQGPIPVEDYVSTLTVREAESGVGCVVEWSSEFTPSGAPESEAVAAVRGLYEAGLENLKKMLGM